MLAKKMRLAAAELTDVGRRRERNQDNVTHIIPDDPHQLETKGALFVVCDGMGGHAAGEVASELGVKAISDSYYSTRETNIISMLAGSIERANEAIYEHARVHPELAGMGTTVVAAAVVDGRAYIVNIGDSRAYIVRNGHMRQITRDHSWVAEQVRVGLLTEEQARTHSHRNVITRSLGTQPSVTADLFVETLQDGDRLLLCTDGLHGYVEPDEIEREMVSHDDPDRAVRNLIDMANNNGGPDNITAVIVQLLEVPAPSGEIQLPTGAMSQGVTQPLPAVQAPPRPAAVASKKPAAVAAAPAAMKKSPPKRSSALINAVRVLAVVVIIAIIGSVWYLQFGPYAQQQAANQQALADVAAAQQAATQASSQSPSAALAQLATTRQLLLTDLDNTQLEPDTRTKVSDALNQQVEPAIQQALQQYNAAAHITPITTAATHTALPCVEPGAAIPAPLNNPTVFAPVTIPAVKGKQPPRVQIIYALDDAHTINQIRIPTDAAGVPDTTAISCVQLGLPQTVAESVVTLTSSGTTLYALAQGVSGNYEVISLVATGLNADGTPQTKFQKLFDVPTGLAEKPNQIAVQGTTFYIAYSRVSATTPGGIAGGLWTYTGTAPKAPKQTLLLSQTVRSLLVTNNNMLYLLLDDGSLGQLGVAGLYAPLSVSVATPLAPLTATDYKIATPVPQPAATSTPAPTPTAAPTTAAVGVTPTATPAPGVTPTGTLFPGGVLLADPTQSTHILLADSASNRVVRFAASAPETLPALTLLGQYVYSGINAGPVAIVADNVNLHVFTWSQDQLVSYPIPLAAAA